MTAQVTITELADGRIARVQLDAGKGNVITRALTSELGEAFAALGARASVRAVVLTAAGDHFSFGASVPEHLPGEVEQMLPGFHELFRTLARAAVPVVGAVRGSCLGGGLEVAMACHHLVVAEDAKLGVPEVTLGVFPPVAAALLPLRCSQATVDRLVGTGQIVSGVEAVALGLADQAVAAPRVEEVALEHAGRYAKLSGVAVRFATRAARAAWDEALGERLARLEALYLGELMKTEDAVEGIRAFMDKRKPEWKDR